MCYIHPCDGQIQADPHTERLKHPLPLFRSLCRQRHRKTPSFPQFLAGAAADAPAEMLVTQGGRC